VRVESVAPDVLGLVLGEPIVVDGVVVVLGDVVVVLGDVVVEPVAGAALFWPWPVADGFCVRGAAVVSFGFVVPGVCVGPAPPPAPCAYTVPMAAARPRVAAIAPFLILLMSDLLLH
jgi:hypothetical protein